MDWGSVGYPVHWEDFENEDFSWSSDDRRMDPEMLLRGNHLKEYLKHVKEWKITPFPTPLKWSSEWDRPEVNLTPFYAAIWYSEGLSPEESIFWRSQNILDGTGVPYAVTRLKKGGIDMEYLLSLPVEPQESFIGGWEIDEVPLVQIRKTLEAYKDGTISSATASSVLGAANYMSGRVCYTEMANLERLRVSLVELAKRNDSVPDSLLSARRIFQEIVWERFLWNDREWNKTRNRRQFLKQNIKLVESIDNEYQFRLLLKIHKKGYTPMLETVSQAILEDAPEEWVMTYLGTIR